MIQLRALRLLLLNRTWMMSKYVICWLHHCTHWRQKHVPTDHEFITTSDKTQCQVHLTSEKVHGNRPQCSHTKESRVKKHTPAEKAFPQDINGSRKRRNFIEVLSSGRSYEIGCDIFQLCTGVFCYSDNIARACTSAGPLSLKAKLCFHIGHHVGFHGLVHCALNPHW